MPRNSPAPTLDKLIQQLREAEKKGDQAEAKQKLAEIENLLNKLQTAKILTPQEAQEAEKANKKGRQQTGAVQDMVQREGKLMDNGQHRAPRPSALPPQFNPDGAEPPQDADQMEANEESRSADATTQRALSRALDALKQSFKNSGGKVPKSFDNAGQAMGEATQSLTQGAETPAPPGRSARHRRTAKRRQGHEQANGREPADGDRARRRQTR